MAFSTLVTKPLVLSSPNTEIHEDVSHPVSLSSSASIKKRKNQRKRKDCMISSAVKLIDSADSNIIDTTEFYVNTTSKGKIAESNKSDMNANDDESIKFEKQLVGEVLQRKALEGHPATRFSNMHKRGINNKYEKSGAEKVGISIKKTLTCNQRKNNGIATKHTDWTLENRDDFSRRKLQNQEAAAGQGNSKSRPSCPLTLRENAQIFLANSQKPLCLGRPTYVPRHQNIQNSTSFYRSCEYQSPHWNFHHPHPEPGNCIRNPYHHMPPKDFNTTHDNEDHNTGSFLSRREHYGQSNIYYFHKKPNTFVRGQENTRVGSDHNDIKLHSVSSSNYSPNGSSHYNSWHQKDDKKAPKLTKKTSRGHSATYSSEHFQFLENLPVKIESPRPRSEPSHSPKLIHSVRWRTLSNPFDNWYQNETPQSSSKTDEDDLLEFDSANDNNNLPHSQHLPYSNNDYGKSSEETSCSSNLYFSYPFAGPDNYPSSISYPYPLLQNISPYTNSNYVSPRRGRQYLHPYPYFHGTFKEEMYVEPQRDRMNNMKSESQLLPNKHDAEIANMNVVQKFFAARWARLKELADVPTPPTDTLIIPGVTIWRDAIDKCTIWA